MEKHSTRGIQRSATEALDIAGHAAPRVSATAPPGAHCRRLAGNTADSAGSGEGPPTSGDGNAAGITSTRRRRRRPTRCSNTNRLLGAETVTRRRCSPRWLESGAVVPVVAQLAAGGSTDFSHAGDKGSRHGPRDPQCTTGRTALPSSAPPLLTAWHPEARAVAAHVRLSRRWPTTRSYWSFIRGGAFRGPLRPASLGPRPTGPPGSRLQATRIAELVARPPARNLPSCRWPSAPGSGVPAVLQTGSTRHLAAGPGP